MLLIAPILALLAQPIEFDFIPTNTFGGIIANVEVNGSAATGYDWIAAYDEDNICAGAVQLTTYGAQTFCNLQVYGDDYTTDNADEGINEGETFTFKLWDAATDKILDHPMEISHVTGWDDGLNGTSIPGYIFTDEIVLNFLRDGPPPLDEDEDGFFGLVDPDDTNPCNPSNNVVVCDTDEDGMPDGTDPYPDCNGIVDECGVCNGTGIAIGTCDCDGTLPNIWYADDDYDGLGDSTNAIVSCVRPAGFVNNADDVDDTTTHPDSITIISLPIGSPADGNEEGNSSTDIDSEPENNGDIFEDDNDAETISIESVPTLSQWGFILLSLILLSIATVSIIQNKNSLGHSRGTISIPSFIPHFDAALFRRMFLKSIPAMLIIFVMISFIEDGWFARNLIGTVMSVIIVVYILHFIILSELFDKK